MEPDLSFQLMLDEGRITTDDLGVQWMTIKENFRILSGLNNSQKAAIRALCYTNLLIGFLVRYLMWKAFVKQPKIIPIGLIIITDDAIKMVGYTTAFFFAIVVAETETPLSETIGQFWCYVIHFCSAIGVVQTYMGGLSIAVMRFLYVKYPLVTLKHDWKIAAGIAVGSTVFTFLTSFMSTVSPTHHQYIYHICMGRSQGLTQLLFDLEQLDNSSKAYTVTYVLLLGIGLLENIAEITIYVVICVHLVKHNRSLRGTLSELLIKKRVKGNAIALGGQIVIFLLENYYFAGFGMVALFPSAVAFTQNNKSIMYLLPLCFNYGIIGIVSIILSSQLKQEFIQLLYKLFFVDHVVQLIHMLNFLGIFRSLHHRVVFVRQHNAATRIEHQLELQNYF